MEFPKSNISLLLLIFCWTPIFLSAQSPLLEKKISYRVKDGQTSLQGINTYEYDSNDQLTRENRSFFPEGTPEEEPLSQGYTTFEYNNNNNGLLSKSTQYVSSADTFRRVITEKYSYGIDDCIINYQQIFNYASMGIEYVEFEKFYNESTCKLDSTIFYWPISSTEVVPSRKVEYSFSGDTSIRNVFQSYNEEWNFEGQQKEVVINDQRLYYYNNALDFSGEEEFRYTYDNFGTVSTIERYYRLNSSIPYQKYFTIDYSYNYRPSGALNGYTKNTTWFILGISFSERFENDLYCDELVKTSRSYYEGDLQGSEDYFYTIGTECIESEDLEQVKIYPNPTASILKIESESLFNKDFQIEVYNAIGQRVKNLNFTKRFDTLELDVQAFAQGVYFLTLRIEEVERSYRFLKEG